MDSTLSRFCDRCGALVAQHLMICPSCGTALHVSHLAPLISAASLPSALSTSAAAEPLRPGSLFAQRYRILSSIGEGGFGVIYKAQDIERHGRPVAIKQINLSALSPREMIEATDSYNREVRHLSQLRHDSIPRIYASLTDPQHWYVVMDFIEGQSLEDKLKETRGRGLSAARVLEIGLALCDVLGYLHTQHPPIIFRDVKPANIMLTRAERLYLIDFGIARQYAPERTRDTGPLGTPGYAAPEQYGKAQTTAQTDIYALGATLQTLLTGKEPLELAGSSANQEQTIRRRIPRHLQPLLQHMLEPDASKRPQSMDEVKESLLWVKEQTAAQRVKRAPAFMRDFLMHSGPGSLLLVALLLFIFVLFSLTGFFSSPLWIPYLLLVLCGAVGLSAYSLHRARQEAPTRLSVKEAVSIVVNCLKSSLSLALIPTIIICYYFSALQRYPSLTSIGDYLVLGGLVLVFILGGLYWLKWNMSELWHRVPSRQQGRPQEEDSPLQQQIQKQLRL
jgi:serine/threonine protein kinase